MGKSKKANSKVSVGSRKQEAKASADELDAREPVITEELHRRLRLFIEYHPSRRLNRSLRCMLFEFLTKEGVPGSWYFDNLMYDLEGLFELLDVIEKECPKYSIPEDDDY